MGRIIIISVIALFIILVGINSCTIVKPGHRGVKVTMGAVSEIVLDEGLHFKTPFFQKIVKIPVMVQKASFTQLGAASSSMQDVFSDVTVSFHIKPEKVNIYYKKFGKEPMGVMNMLLSAKLQEIVKATTNGYSTEELLRKRSEVRDIVYTKLTKVANNHDVVLDEFSMTNFRFSDTYQAAIEEKQVMEQKAETAQKSKEVAQQQGEAKIISAKAEAESNRLRQQTITPMLIEWEVAQKWDGKLPTVTGSGGTIINLPSTSK